MDPGLQYELQYRFLRNPLGHFDPAIAPPLVHYADYPIPQQNNNGFAIHQFLVDPTNPQIPLVHLLHQRIMTAMYHNEGNKEAQALNVAQATLDTMGRLLTHKVGVDVLLDDIFSSNLFGRDVNKQQFDVKIKEFVGGTWKVQKAQFPYRDGIIGHASFTGSDQTICFALKYSAAHRHYLFLFLTRVPPGTERIEDFETRELREAQYTLADNNMFFIPH